MISVCRLGCKAQNETCMGLNTPLPVPQIYLLLSCCPCEGRISGIVDVPNACCTLAIPIAIFDQVRPRPGALLSGPHCAEGLPHLSVATVMSHLEPLQSCQLHPLR